MTTVPLFPSVADAFRTIQNETHNSSRDAGWWTDLDTGEPIDPETVFAEKLVLIHSELSEAVEAHRKGLMDDKLTHRSGVEVELADAVIRIGDLAGALNLDLGGAIEEKLAFNKRRADHKLENRRQDGGKKY